MKPRIIIVLLAALIPFCVTRAEKCDAPNYAKKESKALQKQGWRPFADDGCLAEQLFSKFLMENEYDENLRPKYVFSEVTSDFCLSLDEANKIFENSQVVFANAFLDKVHYFYKK